MHTRRPAVPGIPCIAGVAGQLQAFPQSQPLSILPAQAQRCNRTLPQTPPALSSLNSELGTRRLNPPRLLHCCSRGPLACASCQLPLLAAPAGRERLATCEPATAGNAEEGRSRSSREGARLAATEWGIPLSAAGQPLAQPPSPLHSLLGAFLWGAGKPRTQASSF